MKKQVALGVAILVCGWMMLAAPPELSAGAPPGATPGAGAELSVPACVSDHMVLQQGMAAPIWGIAASGAHVRVNFRDQEKSAVADATGKWMVKLDNLKASTMEASAGEEITIASGAKTITIKDVLVGEVWVGSGQSNMELGPGMFNANDPALAKRVEGTYPKLRLLTKTGKWMEATPAHNKGFSALMLSFGVPLQQELNCPVGLMVGAVGGTPSGYWLTQAMFDADPACQEATKKALATYPAALERYQQALAKYEEASKKYDAELAEWKKTHPATQAADARGADKNAAKPPAAPRKPIEPARPGSADGKTGCLYDYNVRPFVGYGIKGVLWDQGESGTAIVGVDQYPLMGALIKGWRQDWGQGEFPWIYVQKPSGDGCAWDPGNGDNVKADAFAERPQVVPLDGQVVETYVKISQYPNTAMVIASDLGSGIHPQSKSSYGHRALRVALGLAYGKDVEYYGPVYASHQVEGEKVIVKFAHVGKGLAFQGGEKLQGFAVAGADKKFFWAEATIAGDAVVLTCAEVKQPVAVRYAWASKRPWANLFNQDGLPAVTFRTDGW